MACLRESKAMDVNDDEVPVLMRRADDEVLMSWKIDEASMR